MKRVAIFFVVLVRHRDAAAHINQIKLNAKELFQTNAFIDENCGGLGKRFAFGHLIADMHVQTANLNIRHLQNAANSTFGLLQINAGLSVECSHQTRMRGRRDIGFNADTDMRHFLLSTGNLIDHVELIKRVNIDEIKVMSNGVFQVFTGLHNPVEYDIFAFETDFYSLLDFIERIRLNAAACILKNSQNSHDRTGLGCIEDLGVLMSFECLFNFSEIAQQLLFGINIDRRTIFLGELFDIDAFEAKLSVYLAKAPILRDKVVTKVLKDFGGLIAHDSS